MTDTDRSSPILFLTGDAGFIGSAVARKLVRETEHRVVVLDKLTDTGNLDSLREVADSDRLTFERVDIGDAPANRRLFEAHRPGAVLHLAAESHVDRSIRGPADFTGTNLVGSFTLLDESLRYWERLPQGEREAFRFLYVSTDEVYRSLGDQGRVPARGGRTRGTTPTRRRRRGATTWSVRGTGRTGCPWSSRTARTPAGRTSSRRS